MHLQIILLGTSWTTQLCQISIDLTSKVRNLVLINTRFEDEGDFAMGIFFLDNQSIKSVLYV